MVMKRVSRRTRKVACIKEVLASIQLVARVKCFQEAAESWDLILPVKYLNFAWYDSLFRLSYSSVFCLPSLYTHPWNFLYQSIVSISLLNWEGVFFLSYNEKQSTFIYSPFVVGCIIDDLLENTLDYSLQQIGVHRKGWNKTKKEQRTMAPKGLEVKNRLVPPENGTEIDLFSDASLRCKTEWPNIFLYKLI